MSAPKKFKSIFALILLNHISGSHTTWQADPPYYAQQYMTGIIGPRGLAIDDCGDVLVLLRTSSGVTAVWETTNEDGIVTVERTTIVNGNGLGLNHGIVAHGGYIYASSSSTVYRWSYVACQRTVVLTPPQTVIAGILTGGHNTRTLVFDAQNRLYVSVGSNANVDQNSDRARIRRFMLDNIPADGIPFGNGEVFADGLRNEVGMAFDASGVLWGVENGADNLNRPDIGGDIHNGNPAEEFNQFGYGVGTNYGYPYCFSTHNLPGYSAGTQFAWPSFMNDGVHTDDWCNTFANNRPPALAMNAHMAPLGVTFYNGTSCGVNGGFPCSFIGDAVVAFHGSWNSVVKVGYKVSIIPFNRQSNLPIGEINNVLYEPNLIGCGLACFRPVNALFNKNGHLIVSNFYGNSLFRVTYGTPPPPLINSE